MRRHWPSLVLLVAALAVLVVASVQMARRTPPPALPAPAFANGPMRAPAPAAPLPPVEPLLIQEMTPDKARAINAAVPFAATKIPPAPPFRYAAPPAERERALTCLASAVWYEAGNDTVGQQAVAQVVLNRMRHPAYPKSVCGVVFQGAERRTGCQFTFTCDGALARRPSADGWRGARKVAAEALSGFVYKPVGTATHYHTDWVVPYWSATLDKIAKVHTHIFFRWKGPWGQPAAFVRPYRGPEPFDPRIAPLADPALLAAGGAPGSLPIVDWATELAAPAKLFIPGVTTDSLKGSTVRRPIHPTP